jgi:hypothetical protein
LYALFDDARNVSVLLLSELCRAGVFAGLELKTRISHPNDPPAARPVGFAFGGAHVQGSRTTINTLTGAGGTSVMIRIQLRVRLGKQKKSYRWNP